MFDVWFMQLWVCLISTSCLCSSVARSVPLRAVQILRPGAERETPPHAALPWMVCPGQLRMFILFIRNSPFACLCLKASASFFNLQGKRKRKQSQQISGSTSRLGFFNICHWQSSHIHKYRTWWYLKDFGISVKWIKLNVIHKNIRIK